MDPKSIRIEVLNGCGVPKIAMIAKIYLRNIGFDVLDIGDTTEQFKESLIVEHINEDKRHALAVAKELGISKRNVLFVKDTLQGGLYHVTFILGDDYRKYIPDTVKAIQ